MSDLIVKIGDEALDLSAGQVIAITKQAAKVGDFSRVLADGTNETTVPLTSRNKSILENAEILQTDSDKPYRRLPATLIQEGYETLQDGYGIIQSSENDFSLQIIGGNASFFGLIKDLNLRDLDLSEYDHFWTNENVFLNRNNTDGFIYALFEQSDDSANPTLSTYGTNLYAVQTEMLLPCFFVHTLIEKIFAAQGYNFVSDITALDIYDNMVVFIGKDWNRGTDASYLNFSEEPIAYSMPGEYSLVGFAAIATNLLTQELNFWDTPLPYGVITSFGYLAYLIPDNSSVTLSFSIDFDNTYSVSVPVELRVFSTSPGGLVMTLVATWNLPAGVSTQTATFTVDCLQSAEQQCGYAISLNGLPGINVTGGTNSAEFTFISSLELTTTSPYNYIRGISAVPDMLQTDFLKEIAREFQLVYDTDEVTHTVTAQRFDLVKENIPQALDFSTKLHDDKTVIQYRVAGYAQINNLKYKPDDITKYTAQGIITVDDETLEGEKTVVEMSKFAASSTVLRFDTVNAPYVPLFTEGLPTNGMTDRLLLIRRETFPYNINYNRSTESPTDWPTNDVTFAYFMEAGNTDSLDFPTLITRFYQAINDMLYRAKTVDCKMNLNIKDVVNYNPFIPVYIGKYNNYFYWEKLENYVKGKLTRCRFIKL